MFVVEYGFCLGSVLNTLFRLGPTTSGFNCSGLPPDSFLAFIIFSLFAIIVL